MSSHEFKQGTKIKNRTKAKVLLSHAPVKMASASSSVDTKEYKKYVVKGSSSAAKGLNIDLDLTDLNMSKTAKIITTDFVDMSKNVTPTSVTQQKPKIDARKVVAEKKTRELKFTSLSPRIV